MSMQHFENGDIVKLTNEAIKEMEDEGLTEEEISGVRGHGKVLSVFEDASVGLTQELTVYFPEHQKMEDGSDHPGAYFDDAPAESFEKVEEITV